MFEREMKDWPMGWTVGDDVIRRRFSHNAGQLIRMSVALILYYCYLTCLYYKGINIYLYKDCFGYSYMFGFGLDLLYWIGAI